jgi:GNAT superfamily N-acetyltransferase
MRVERLSAHHDFSSFTCGVQSLDDWVREHALENQRRDLSRTFVLIDEAGGIRGYYSLTMGGVRRDDLQRRLGRGLPDVDIGMVLVARLAIAADHHGQGLGRDLIIDAIDRAASAGAQVAARFLGVDPIDDAAAKFYAKFGFRDVPGDPGGRMYLRIADAIATLRP